MPASSGGYSWRAQMGIGLVLLMVVLAMGTLAGYHVALQKHATSLPGEQRFRALRAVLPARGTVGYLTDMGPWRQNQEPYYLAQYSLAPVVVAPDPNHELVVANCTSSHAVGEIAAANGFMVERDLGNGVALLRRLGR
jgi:hypothetical protein